MEIHVSVNKEVIAIFFVSIAEAIAEDLTIYIYERIKDLMKNDDITEIAIVKK